jgi:hypothetical protein
MSAGLPFANTQQFTATTNGRTITPSGPIVINDGRQRLPAANAAVTLNASVEQTAFDVYAAAAAGNAYTLLAVAAGTDMSARRDVIHVGQAIDYPSRNGCTWLPLPGGGNDAYLGIDQYGVHVRQFASAVYPWPYASLILDPAPPPGNGSLLYLSAVPNQVYIQDTVQGISDMAQSQQLQVSSNGILTLAAVKNINMQTNTSSSDIAISSGGTLHLYNSGSIIITPISGNGQTVTFDQYGFMRRTQTPAPTVALGPGGGTGGSPSASVRGTDEVGAITVVTGASTPGGRSNVVTFTYAFPFQNVPYGVMITPTNAATEDLGSNQQCSVFNNNVTTTSFIISSGQQSLGTNTAYQWVYRVLPA